MIMITVLAGGSTPPLMVGFATCQPLHRPRRQRLAGNGHWHHQGVGDQWLPVVAPGV